MKELDFNYPIHELDSNGFLVLKRLIEPSLIEPIYLTIKEKIYQNANAINVKLKDYLYCTGRWADPSSITDSIPKKVDHSIQEYLENLINEKISIQKKNIICKNDVIRDAVHWHQDISYSPKSPYHFSLWLTLNDITERDGPLQFILGSHKTTILPAVDFWSPSFKKNAKPNINLRNEIVTIPLQKGDAVIFDSRLWHASEESYDGADRYAYVTRWCITDKPFPPIPDIESSSFGMWNCHHLTIEILSQGLKLLNYKAISNSLDGLLAQWKEIVSNHLLLPGLNTKQAKKDLENLIILHKAATMHNAGDLMGRIYKNLWNSLLSKIQQNTFKADKSFL